MERMRLHPDFKEFLKLLNSHGVEYLLVGGYAIGYYGYPRATADMDIWIATDERNSGRMVDVLHDFGMPADETTKKLLLEENNMIRMGMPPVRIEVLTSVSGVDFQECFSRRTLVDVEGVPVNFISIDDLKKNKKASGRHKDIDDLEHLP